MTQTVVSAAPTTTPQTQTADASGSSSGSLSTGAKAGIAVGAVVGGLALLAVAGLLVRRARRAGSGPAEVPAANMASPASKFASTAVPAAELGNKYDETRSPVNRAELDAGGGDGTWGRAELGAAAVRVAVTPLIRVISQVYNNHSLIRFLPLHRTATFCGGLYVQYTHVQRRGS